MDYFDVAIIGAGPGGCASALALKDSGLRVVLIDKAVFPRDKTCGDAIPGNAFKAMEALHPDWAQRMRQFADSAQVRASRGVAPNGKTVTLEWKLFSYNSKRLDFDHFLLRLVQAHTKTVVLENKRMVQAIPEAHGIQCRFQDGSSCMARLVIGCDGANSIVSRQLSAYRPAKENACVAVRTYFRGVADVQSSVNEFHFFKNWSPGYFWLFPLENGWVNVGFGLLRENDRNRPAQLNLRTGLEEIIARSPRMAPRFKRAESLTGIKGFALPIGTRKRRISGRRFLLCGDAASLINPLWGHGIDTAMWSGYLAGRHALECFSRNDFSADFNRQYDRRVYEKFGSEFARSTMALKLFQHFPSLLDPVFSLGSNEKMLRWLARFM